MPLLFEQVTGKKPYQGLSPHTAVAQGAAIHAAILEAKHRGSGSDLAEKVRKHLEQVKQETSIRTAWDVIIRNPQDRQADNHVMIPRNTRLPVEVKQVFNTIEAGQTRATRAGAGRRRPRPRCLLADWAIAALPSCRRICPRARRWKSTIGSTATAAFASRARDKTGGREAAIEIQRRGGLDEQQIDAYTALASEYLVE